jgi:hypothetical protein
MKPMITGSANPTGSKPDKHSCHHFAALPWNGDTEL